MSDPTDYGDTEFEDDFDDEFEDEFDEFEAGLPSSPYSRASSPPLPLQLPPQSPTTSPPARDSAWA